MSPGAARNLVPYLMFAVAIAVVVLVAGALFGGDKRKFQAEFETARGIVEGGDLRLNGAPAGRIESVELTDRGTALITASLDDGVPAPRADAAVVARPRDLLGSYYVSYSPGRGARPLSGPVPVSRTGNLTRLTDVNSALGRKRTAAGLQAMLVELGLGLESRGVDINRAAVELRPALEATDDLMEELSSQNTALRTLIADSGRATRQVAERAGDFDGMLTALSQTLRGVAEHTTGIDRGLERAAPALSQLQSTTGKLAQTAVDAGPLAHQLGEVAPGLSRAMVQLRPFLDRARATSAASRPTLRRTTTLLHEGGPTFTALERGLGALRVAAPDLASLTETLRQVSPLISEGLLVKTAGQSGEPGNQPGDPTTDPLMRLWRGVATPSCESFGMSIRPGCLEAFLASTAKPRRSARSRKRARQSDRRARRQVPRVERAPRRGSARPGFREAPLSRVSPDAGPKAPAAPQNQTDRLLDFLLRP